MLPVRLIEHHIEEDGNPLGMTLVDKLLVIGRCAVSLIGSEI